MPDADPAGPGAAPEIDALLRRLDAERVPAARLPLLLAAADGVAAADARRALEHATEAAAVAEALGDRRALAEAVFLAGRCRERLLEHAAALASYERAREAFESAGDDAGTARALRAMSFLQDILGDFSQALMHQLRALEIDERIGVTANRAVTLRTIGLVCSKTGDHEGGLEFYRQSLAAGVAENNPLERGKTLNNIGVNLKNVGRCDEALSALVEALQLFESLGEPLLQCATLNNLGLVHQELGDAAAAERTLRDALGRSESVAYVQGAAHAQMALGRLYAGQDRTEEAQARLHAALRLCERQAIKVTAYECHEALAGLYERLGDAVKALHHFRRFHEIEREVHLESASNRLRAFAIQYQVAAAKRDAELQRERQAVLKRANEELDALNVSLTEANLQKTMLLDQLERQTYEDALTGLANRRRLDQRLADEFALARRHGRPLAVAMADLDHFKRVNDRYSHAVGDAALRAVGKVLSAHVRQTDLVARFGGEEFVIVLAHTDPEAAMRVCEKLRAAVEAHPWDGVQRGLALTLSIGVCADTTLAGHERMLATADRNLYRAKAAGRNRVVG